MKWIIVGDSAGKIYILNYFGTLMKSLNPHEGAEITNLKCADTNIGSVIISTATDNIIRFHTDNDSATSLI